MIVLGLSPISSEEGDYDLTVILVSDNMADSAMAHMIAEELNAEVYFTPWGEYDQEIADEITALAPTEIFIIGGYAAVPQEYDYAFSELTFTRIGGDDRSQTSLRLLQYFRKMFQQGNVYVVNGDDENEIGKALQKALENGTAFVYTNRPGDASDVSLELNDMGFYWGDSMGSETGNMQADAEAAMASLEDKLSELLIILPDYPSNPVIVLHSNALRNYERAQQSYEEGDFGKAYCYALTGITLADNALDLVEKGNFYKGNLAQKSACQLEDLIEKRAQLDEYLALLDEVPEEITAMIDELDGYILDAGACYESGDYECTLNNIALAKYLLIDISKALETLLGMDVSVNCEMGENAQEKLNELLEDRQELDGLISQVTDMPEELISSLAALDALIGSAQECFENEDYVCTLETISDAKSLLNQIEHDIESLTGDQGNNGNGNNDKGDDGNNGKGNDDKEHEDKGKEK